MVVAPAPRRVSMSSGQGHSHSRLARWAVGLSVGFGAAFVSSIAIIASAYAVGGEGGIEDTWLGMLLAAITSVGVLGSLAAFVLAIVARVQRERWALLWLPLCVFPALVLFVMLGEVFWWE